MSSGGSGRKAPALDTSLTDLAVAGIGKWIDIRGCSTWNVMLEAATFTGTVTIEGSFDGETNHGTLDAGITFNDPLANITVDKPVPYIRARVTLRTTGKVDKLWIYGV